MRAPLLLLTLSGCAIAVKANGVIQHSGDAVIIAAPSGKSRALELGPAQAPIAALDGLLVELDGVTHRGAIVVDNWRVVQGPHGLSAWVGVLSISPQGLVLDDRANELRMFLSVDDDHVLWDAVGRWVMVEGAVDGPFTVQVWDSRVLDVPVAP